MAEIGKEEEEISLLEVSGSSSEDSSGLQEKERIREPEESEDLAETFSDLSLEKEEDFKEGSFNVEKELPANEETKESGVVGENEDFFEKFSSIRISYAESEKKHIQEFVFSVDEADGQLSEQLWPTLGGWNIDDLYSEVLYALVRGRGPQSEADGLICHLQQVFHIDNDKHTKLLQAAREKKAPPVVLNLEVVEAKGLKGKDVNGLSDPFCTLYVSPKQKHNTSMKPETLNPVWREYFSFPVSSLEEDVLNIEVWDYDPEETLTDKMKRFGEVKSTRGLRILMKEIALTASTGKQSHEFLGCLKLPLKSIPAEGMDQWCGLEGRNGNGHKKKGEVHLRMALGAEKEKKVAAQEYRHVLHLLLVHELDEENVEPHQWEGRFSKHSEYILHQLELLGGLTQKDVDVARWIVYTRVQFEHPLNAKLFIPLFKNIVQYVKSHGIEDDEIRKFWFSARKLVDNFAAFFKNIHQCFLPNSNAATQTYHMLKLLEMLVSYLKSHQPTNNNREFDEKISVEYVIEKTENAISRGANELFTGIAQPLSESPVEKMTKIGQILVADLRKGLDTHQSLFKELLGVDYFDITYKVYDEKYHDQLKPLVEEICSHLRPLNLRDEDGSFGDQDVSMGTNLFELYLAVKQFSDMASQLTLQKDLYIQGSYHNWFHTGVAQWLDIAYYKAMNRIKKAVELDTLKPIDDFAHFTSSAVDTAHIYHQIQIFWNQLAWPEVEGSYSFIAKILDDLCRCTIYYAEIMCKKVDEMEKAYEDKYEVSDELCFAINNIEWVGMEMKPLSEKLGMHSIIRQLKDIRGESVAAQCERTLTTVMENAAENVNNKIIDVLEKVGNKMRPMILRLLLEGSEAAEGGDKGVEKLMKYLDNNLIKLKRKLSQTNFDKMFAILWENAAVALRELISTNIEKRRPPSFFKQIHNMLQILIRFFYPEGTARMDDAYDSCISELEELVGLYGASTMELMMKYYQSRYEQQVETSSKKSELGSLTVRAHYCEDIHTLRIEILNARNLKSHDSNGQCDPYVTVKLIPREAFLQTQKYKTKVKKKTLFPLFDETISIILSPDEMSTGGMVLFTLKDHDLFGRNDYLGECFLPLEAIPFTMDGTNIQDLPQRFLSITKPKDDKSVILGTLENRAWDRVAVDFAKHERQKFFPDSANASISSN